MSVYDDYIRSTLGYDMENYKNTYRNYDDFMDYSNYISQQQSERKIEALEECYPDIYKIVYPMVKSACEKNTRDINSNLIEEMTNEIYFAIEDNSLNENRTNVEKNSNIVSTSNIKTENRNENTNRQIIRNQGLNDLIRILILRELLGRTGPGPNFRPRPPRPPRPPMPNPPRPPRPQFNRSIYEQDYGLYQQPY